VFTRERRLKRNKNEIERDVGNAVQAERERLMVIECIDVCWLQNERKRKRKKEGRQSDTFNS
jgi:hypothetical protein